VVESTALEMRRTGNRTVGSNPTLSARLNALTSLDKSILRGSCGSAPWYGQWSTAEVRRLSIKSENRPAILWRHSDSTVRVRLVDETARQLQPRYVSSDSPAEQKSVWG
jgi:hypothetical protein